MLQKDVAANFSDYLQRASKEQSSVVERMKEFIACGERIKHQLESNYLDLASYEPISEVPVNTTPEEAPATKISPDTQETYNQLNHVSSCTKRESSVSSIKSRTRSKCPPRRSRASVTSGTVSDTEFSCQPQFGKLWKPDEIAPTSTRDTAVSDELDSSMPIGEPEKCLSQEELIAEVKGIYAGLVMVESKCIEVDNFQEQPIAEVNGIYAGLVMVESKCIEVEDFQPTQDKTRLDNRERKTNIARLASLHETSLAFEDDDPKHITSTKSLTVERLRECMERLEAASSNLSSSFREPFVALFDAISDWTARLVDDKPGLERYKESHRIIVKNLWRLIRSLRPSLFMPLVSSFHKACASPLRAVPGIEDGKSQDPLAFSIFWYTCLLGVVLGYIALAVYHRDRSFLGVGMGVSAWAYLAMVLVGDEPIHVIVSAGTVCAFFTSMWMSLDLHESGMRKSRQQLSKYCIIISSLIIDAAISFLLAPSENFLLGAQKTQSPGFMMVVFGVPCATLSVVLFKMIRTVAAILVEPNAPLVGNVTPDAES